MCSLSISPGVTGEEGGRFGLLETQHVLAGTTEGGAQRWGALAAQPKPPFPNPAPSLVCARVSPGMPGHGSTWRPISWLWLRVLFFFFFCSLQTSALIPRQVHYLQLNGTPGGAGCANTPAAGGAQPNQQQRPLLAPARPCRGLTADIWQGPRGWRHGGHWDPCSGHPRWLPALLRPGGMDVVSRTTYFYLDISIWCLVDVPW